MKNKAVFLYLCTMFSDEHYMKQALHEAEKALARDEVPIEN